MKGLNVLLTGACGRIGKVFFEASKDRYRFTLTDRIAPDFDLGEHRYINADLSDKASLAGLLNGIDVIVHLSGIPDASAAFEELLPNNILATASSARSAPLCTGGATDSSMLAVGSSRSVSSASILPLPRGMEKTADLYNRWP